MLARLWFTPSQQWQDLCRCRECNRNTSHQCHGHVALLVLVVVRADCCFTAPLFGCWWSNDAKEADRSELLAGLAVKEQPEHVWYEQIAETRANCVCKGVMQVAQLVLVVGAFKQCTLLLAVQWLVGCFVVCS